MKKGEKTMLEIIEETYNQRTKTKDIDLRNKQLAELMTTIERHYKINQLDLEKTEDKEALKLYKLVSDSRDWSIYPDAIDLA